MHVLDMLKERGFIAQVTFEEDLYKALEREPMTFYLGIDPTADSLHVGHFMPIIVAGYLQRAGHRPIILCGGGTAMIGDPSGKSDLRKMMSRETICENVTGIQAQLSRFLDFSDGKAIMANNGDWLLNLNYIDFLREVGALFSVNRMLTAECYKRAWKRALRSWNSTICSCRAMTSSSCSKTTVAACKSAATTSGATCSPAQTSSAARSTRMPLPSPASSS